MSDGICHLVGAGPGDPGLVTLRAKECIEDAEVILYDYLVAPELLRWARPEAEIVYVGKRAGQHSRSQDEINVLLVEHVARGKRVVRLKGGDPFVFGRGGEEAAALAAAGLPFDVVPGISSAIAGPAYAGIPVTHRGVSAQVTIFTGHEDPSKGGEAVDYATIAKLPGTRVILMGVERIGEIARSLMRAGASPELPVAMIRWATTARQETLCGTLATIAGKAEGFLPPAITVVGEVVGLRETLRWFESRPLFGCRVVVTRTRQKAGVLSARLQALGAEVLELPVIRTEPPSDARAFAEAVAHAHTYDWLVFTSPTGVDAFFERFYSLREDARELGGARIAAVGPATRDRLQHYRFKTDVMPEKYVAEQLVESLLATGSMENQTFLLVRPEAAREVLAESLAAAGAIVDHAIAYRTVPARDEVAGARERFREEGADWITFASSSAAENFLTLDLPWPEGMKCASIGPVTSATLEHAGHAPYAVAKKHDIEGLIAAILEAESARGKA